MTLPTYALDESEIEILSQTPIKDGAVRIEFRIPDSKRGRQVNRVVAHGLEKYSEETGVSKSELVRRLVYAYLTGQISVKNGLSIDSSQ